MIARGITYFGKPAVIVCDAKCDKAWGWNSRPREQSGARESLKLDSELGIAPEDPGTYEGTDAKPKTPEERLNKWCAQECERCKLIAPNTEFQLRTFTERHWI